MSDRNNLMDRKHPSLSLRSIFKHKLIFSYLQSSFAPPLSPNLDSSFGDMGIYQI